MVFLQQHSEESGITLETFAGASAPEQEDSLQTQQSRQKHRPSCSSTPSPPPCKSDATRSHMRYAQHGSQPGRYSVDPLHVGRGKSTSVYCLVLRTANFFCEIVASCSFILGQGTTAHCSLVSSEIC